MDNEEEPYVDREYRYNQSGDLEYYCLQEYGEIQVTTYVYDDQGHLLEEDTTDPQGEPLYMERNIYDERGNQLTHEVVWLDSTNWEKVTYTYDEQGRVLTHKRSHDSGWDDRTYTYDEQGNQITETKEGNNSSYTETCEYDEWGNVVRYFMYETYVSGIENAYEETARWELHYYPNGVPEEVQMVIGDAPTP